VSPRRLRVERDWVAVAGAAGVAVALTLLATARYGPGTEPDSVTYLAAAHHLRAGHGFADMDGSPLTLFPPVFPAAVAALEWFGFAPLAGGRLLNAAMFGALVVLAAVWARRISGSPALGGVVAAIVALSTPMVAMASTALSEPVGIVAVVACLMLLTEMMRTGRARFAALAGLAAAVACLTRYASVVLFPVGAVVVLARPGPWRARIRWLATFLAAGVVPFAAWLARNVAAAGNATGDGRGTSALTWFASLKLTFAAVGTWLLPGSAPEWLRSFAGGVVSVGVAGVVVLAARADPGPENRGEDSAAETWVGLALPAVVFVVLGVVSVTWFEATMAIDPPPRFLLPVFVPLVVVAVLVVGEGARRWSWRPAAPAALLVVVLAASLPRLALFERRAEQQGLLDYSTRAWTSSPLLAYLKDHPVRGAVASDDPYILDLRLGIPADLTPARTYYASNEATGELARFVAKAARAAGGGGMSVVWFPRSYQPYLYSLSDLEQALCLRVEQHFADGDLLRSCREGT
jgi:4-amino-4-deoxy-L-arabinose transferase-like glycosyltransferase